MSAIHHIVITDTTEQADAFARVLWALDVPNVTRYGSTVQITIPGHIAEREHWSALYAWAKANIDDFRMGRATDL